MSAQPGIEERAAQPYVAIKGVVTMQSIGAIADRLPDVFGWVSAHGLQPAGAPFLKYNVIDMERQLEIEAGVPVVRTGVQSDDSVLLGVLPAGRYATVMHVGHPAGLRNATGALLDWATEQGLKWDVAETGDGQRWGCRLEIYQTDPNVEPDMDKWETQLAFRLSDVA
jgi:effector-binding domain-containing protein